MMNRKVATGHRNIVLILICAAVLSILILGSGNKSSLQVPSSRGSRSKEGRELLLVTKDVDALISPFMVDQHILSLLQDIEKQHNRNTMDFFNLRRESAMIDRAMPQIEVQEKNDAVIVTVSIPQGISIQEINVEVQSGGLLYIQGGHRDNNSQIRFEKVYALGRHIDPGNISASKSKSGQLVITAPKFDQKKEQEVRKIDVKTEL